MTNICFSKKLKGIPASYGIGVGRAFILSVTKGTPHPSKMSELTLEKEIYRYKKAVNASIYDLKKLHDQLHLESAFEGMSVIDSHLQLLQDPLLTVDVENEIRVSRKSGLAILHKTVGRLQKKFLSLEDPFFQERFRDIQDVADRVMNHLQHKVHLTLSNLPYNAVLFALDLTPSEVAVIKPNTIVGIVTKRGGATSHTAIMAKSKGIPYVANVDFQASSVSHEQRVIVDGRHGEILVNPNADEIKSYNRLRKDWYDQTHNCLELGDTFPNTTDGCQVRLYLNIDTPQEIDKIPKNSAGVGLFRTEFLMTANQPFPNEEAQLRIYESLFKKIPDKPVVIRVFDFGGDKGRVTEDHYRELNPSLGFRAIRFLLKERHIFKTQIRALLRASASGDLRILIPMITSIDELRECKERIRDIEDELREEGHLFVEGIPIGCMLEVPSAALITDHLAKESDFLSFGTNDLVQYTLAVDRTNHLVGNLYSPFHPSLIRLLKHAIKEANRKQVPLSVCGEIASDPCFVPLLIGLGIRDLSLTKHYFPMIKDVIKKISLKDSQLIAKKVLTLSTASEIEKTVSSYYTKLS
ncbi:phosphoenolpyruvate--protein phosphotransferase [Chlamydiales bacterium]|nr:phosphoenolpyruvate--protein phosphotransferase [Chlamydiales bacterium]